MKNHYLFFLVLLFKCGFVFSQAPGIEWSKCYGGSASEQAHDIKQTSDGGYIICGESGSYDGDVSPVHSGQSWVIKIDSLGDLQWQKSYGGSYAEHLNSILETSGGYIAVGSALSNDGDVQGNHGGADLWIIRLDSVGSLIWQRCLGGSNGEEGHCIIKDSTDGFIICGSTYSSDGDITGLHIGTMGLNDIWIIKIDTTGGIIWQKCLGGSYQELGASIRLTLDGGFAVVGLASSNDGDVSGLYGSYINGWIVKLDSIGNLQWQKCLGGLNGSSQLTSVEQSGDSGYVIAGYTSCSSSGNVSCINHSTMSDYWIVKLDGSQNIIWQQCFGGSSGDIEPHLQKCVDGGYLISGASNSSDGDVTGNHGFSDDVWIVRIDSLGNMMWQNAYGGFDNELIGTVINSSNGGFVVSGSTFSSDGDLSGSGFHGYSDYWIFKLGSGHIGLQKPNDIKEFSVFFNGENNNMHFEYYSKCNEKTQLQLLDLTGRILLQQPLFVSQGFNKQEVQTPELSKGIYFVRLVSESGSLTKKLVAY